jgi:uncharacterized membrane protein
MASYHIIGGDAKVYGPIAAEDIRLWITEGRLNAHTQARGEAETTWRTLGSFPEFAEALRGAPATIAPPAYSAAATPASVDYIGRDYELDLGGCVSRGWELVKDNMGIYVVGALIFMLIEGAVGGLSHLPVIGAVFSIVNFVIAGPFKGGLLYMFLRGARGEAAEVEDVFSGFKRAFGQLFLATLVQGMFALLCLSPFIIVFSMKYMALGIQFDPQSMQTDPTALLTYLKTVAPVLLSTLPVLLVCIIPTIYLATSWIFTLPVIMDQGLGFWAAMKTSFKMVNKHWWQVFGLTILIGLLNLAGFFACLIGLLFTVPVGIAALMFAYETIFGARKN